MLFADGVAKALDVLSSGYVLLLGGRLSKGHRAESWFAAASGAGNCLIWAADSRGGRVSTRPLG